MDVSVASDDLTTMEAPAPKRSIKKLLIIAAAVLLLAALGGAGAYWYLGGFSPADDDSHAEVEPETPVFYDLPEIVIRLNGGTGQYLKMGAVLDLASEEQVELIKSIEPRLLDMLQTYLIELSPDDLRGAAGMYRVREDLLRRINDLLPDSTKDVLFKTIILQ